jgi:hypothetical protein
MQANHDQQKPTEIKALLYELKAKKQKYAAYLSSYPALKRTTSLPNDEQ